MFEASTAGPLDELEFLDLLREYFGLPEEAALDARLGEDLGFDSLQYMELLIMLEEIGNHPVPPAVARGLLTLRDVYDTYVTYSAHH
jgi:acyl carrier protein